MRSTRIETRRGWIGERRVELIDAIHRALVATIQIPERDRDIRIMEYDEDAMAVPTGKGPSYLVVEITLFEGRSDQAKKNLYAAIAEEMKIFGHTAADISVILHEVARKNWGMLGIPASDIKLDYTVAL